MIFDKCGKEHTRHHTTFWRFYKKIVNNIKLFIILNTGKKKIKQKYDKYLLANNLLLKDVDKLSFNEYYILNICKRVNVELL